MGLGIPYACGECGYCTIILNGPMMTTGDARFEGATCDSCRELVSVSVDGRDKCGEAECPKCQSAVRLFRDQQRICCPRCGRSDAWADDCITMAD